ncbi:MAG: histidine kinase [Bacteroidota bacterium]|nr:histidine kinase [Bacteroidota bacterium]
MLGFFDKRNIMIRHLIIALIALFFGAISALVYYLEHNYFIWTSELTRNIVSNFIYIAIIWNGNMLLYGLIPHDKLSWEKHTKIKISIATLVALAWPVTVHFAFCLFFYPSIHAKPCDIGSKENIISLIVSVTITLLINAIFAAREFFIYWRNSITEQESLKHNNTIAEFESLKNQVNPHFLFNALNTLTNLIEDEPKLATDFVQKLASVYRYVLTQKDKETVSLNEELDFLNAYVFLNKIRFGENLIVDIKVDPKLLSREMATLTLQILIENAIKHNVISKINPLTIRIESEGNHICVSNNMQPKTVLTESNGIGLNNIASRYAFLSKKSVEIENNGKTFKVCVPLI